MALRDEFDSQTAPLPLRICHHRSSSSPSSSSCFSHCFPCSWLRSKKSEHIKCPNFISNIGKRRHHSADFRYDPLSYALNFDEGAGEDAPVAAGEDARCRGFVARLPASPPCSRFFPVRPN